jgi:hypothetical protein
LTRSDKHRASGKCVVDGISDQVSQNAGEQNPVAERGLLRIRDSEGDSPETGGRFKLRRQILQNGAQRHRSGEIVARSFMQLHSLYKLTEHPCHSCDSIRRFCQFSVFWLIGGADGIIRSPFPCAPAACVDGNRCVRRFDRDP